MSTYHPFDHRRWGNRLVVNRSLDLWREYGAESALFELKGDWNKFLFTGDARDLALVPQTIAEKADQIFDHELRNGITLWGGEMYEKYNDQRSVSSREMSTWKKAFIEAYSEQLEENISEVIPPELENKLELFCGLVTAIAHHLEGGGDAEDFGVSLGRKEITKIHPQKVRIVVRATKEGTAEADRNWAWQQGGGFSIRSPYISLPYDWQLDGSDEELFEKTYYKAYFSAIRDHLEKTIPRKAWKNAFLICSLYDEMQAQKDRKKKYGSQKGWAYLRSRREHEVFMTERRKEEARKYHEERLKKKSAPTMGISDLRAQFASPQISITAGAKAAFEQSGEQPAKFLDRHFSGDFGEVTPNDAAMNIESLKTHGGVMSIYRLNTGVRFYIITDDGHLTTTILLPHEY